MTNDYRDRILKVGALLSEGGDPEIARAEGLLIKQDMSQELLERNLLINTLDHIIASFAPSPNWLWGYLPIEQLPSSASGQVQRSPKYDRRNKTLEVAGQIAIETGGKVLHVSEIAERLKPAGEDLGERALATAVGNILTRSGKWQRVGPGQYAPVSSSDSN